MRPSRKPRLGRALIALSVAFALSACWHDNPAELMQSAREYRARGDHQAAIIQLKNVLQAQPNLGEARLLLGQSALVLGDAPGAEREFRRALAAGQPDTAVVPLIATAMVEGLEFERLTQEFGRKTLADAKAEAELRARVGEAALRMRNPSEAARSFDAALVADPGNLTARLGRIRLAGIEGRLDEALAAAAPIAADNRQSVDAWRLLGELKLATGDRAGARTALEQAIAISPATPNSRFELIALLVADNAFDAADAQLRAARAARVADLRMPYFESVIALGRGQAARARDLAQQVLRRAPEHVPSMIVVGAAELQQKQFALAEGHLLKAVSLAPTHVGARALLARTYLTSRQPARAVEVVRPLIEGGSSATPAVLMLAGEAHLANGDLKQAARLFEAASAAREQQPLARTRLGQIALLSGDVEGGVRELQSVIAGDGAPIQAELALLGAYVRQGQTSKALDVAQALVKKRPDDPMVHHTLGSVLLSTQAHSAAREAFAKALELSPTYMPAVTSLAQLDLADGKAPEARSRFEAVLSREPQNELALLGLAEVMARAKAPPTEIAAVLKRAVAAAPQSVPARVALVDLLLLGGDARAALTVAQQAPPETAQDLRMLDAVGRSQFAAGETNQAIDSFRRAAVAEPRSIVPLVRLATVYASRKEHDKAADVLARAQKLAPSDVTVARDLAAATAAMGKGDEALKQARALQASAPKSAAGFVLEGDLHFSARQWSAAERSYRDGLKLAPASEPVAVKLHAAMLAAGRKADADAFARKWGADHPAAIVFQTYLGEQALRARDAKSAVTHYEAVVARQPDNVAALNNLAWALGRIGDPRAIGYAQKALKAAPDNASVLDTMGVLLLAGGDPARAGDVLARATGLAPERHDIRLNYAKALIKAGRADEARQELMKLQRVTQDFAGKSEVAALLGN